MNQHTIVSGYRILNIALAESRFKREPLVSTEATQAQQDSSVSVEYQISPEGNQVLVTETFDYTRHRDGQNEFTAMIQMIGHFERVAEADQEGVPAVESFAKINAPAILYPYIREHLASLTSKAAVGTVILPPYNFMPVFPQENLTE
jgi:preprotein translocase subunit SecB